MGINLSMEDEEGKELGIVPDPKRYLSIALQLPDLEKTICLRFIDPYGDTIFNQLQIPLLIRELASMRDLITDDSLQTLANRSLESARRASLAPTRIREVEEQASAVAAEPIHSHVLCLLDLAGKQRVRYILT